MTFEQPTTGPSPVCRLPAGNRPQLRQRVERVGSISAGAAGGFPGAADWLKAVSALQSILGLGLLFLFGLGIRNRFRLK
jgi:hypothetical protein